MSDTVIKRLLTAGDTVERFTATEQREISLVRGGELAYLWLGNAESPMFCYGTLSGATNLRKLAKAILREVGDTAACEVHPKYMGIRQPSVDCIPCLELYFAKLRERA